MLSRIFRRKINFTSVNLSIVESLATSILIFLFEIVIKPTSIIPVDSSCHRYWQYWHSRWLRS